jgi:hypothetical protein
MTKMLLNTGSVPLYTSEGAPIPPGGIVTDDELDDGHEALVEDGTLKYVRPAELDDQEDLSNLSAAAQEHASGNAERGSGDDASVKKESTSKGGKS